MVLAKVERCVQICFVVRETRRVNSVEAAPASDLVMVADVPSSLTLDERGIIVYLAGYLGTKTVKKHGCHGCELIWRQPSDEADGHEFTFFNNKQYDGMQIGGLVRQSDVLVSFVSAPEMVFREHVTNTVHNRNIRLRHVESVEK